MSEQEGSIKKKERGWISLLIYVVIALLIAIVIRTFVIQNVQVDGPSMQDTLSTGDGLLVEKVSYRLHGPRLYDIIVFRAYEENRDTYYIKRVIGTPGDIVEIKEGQVFINGSVLDDPQGEEYLYEAGIAEDGILLGEDEYFVLGDNRYRSTDSRSSDVGLVKKDSIIGRAFFRVWPINKIGVIN